MVAWMLGVTAGPRVLAGLGTCLRHGPRRHQLPGAKQIAASFLAAHAPCGHLVPNGSQETVAQIQAYLRDAVRFAGCMRTHGLPHWPDPTHGGAQIRFFLPASIDMGSHQVAVAANRCQSLLHVNLETIGMG